RHKSLASKIRNNGIIDRHLGGRMEFGEGIGKQALSQHKSEVTRQQKHEKELATQEREKRAIRTLQKMVRSRINQRDVASFNGDEAEGYYCSEDFMLKATKADGEDLQPALRVGVHFKRAKDRSIRFPEADSLDLHLVISSQSGTSEQFLGYV